MIARSDVSVQFDQALGRKIRECRRSLGMSQEKVVETLSFLGVDMRQQTYANIENGSRTVYPLELALLLRILCIDLEDFVHSAFPVVPLQGVP